MGSIKKPGVQADDVPVLWIHDSWVDGPVDAGHELMEYELGRRAKTDLLHHDLILFGAFV